eukprot:TRINITY_DN3569_c0_g1_i2.p1 TRINITY_DN3569_c0_g1~~TRINITY_DN3569_c0_g1_i2.p1  ORF type:complete len:673 (-),score=145.46 TRINITY_DN3569_c0_g1_i2:53-1999(-)
MKGEVQIDLPNQNPSSADQQGGAKIEGLRVVSPASAVFSVSHRHSIINLRSSDHYYDKNNDASLVHFQPLQIKRDLPHIARGSFGMVFKGHVEGTQDKVVIKDLEIQNDKSLDEWKKEVTVMVKNRSPYIAEIFGYASEGTTLTIVMEFFEYGDLFNVLHKKKDIHPLSVLQRLRMARHCAYGLAFLHKNQVLHRDIKSLNVLVCKDYSCKLTDFGCAKLMNAADSLLLTVATGTPLWMAPEVKTGSVYSYPADVYSMGLVMYEIFERQIPGYDQQRGMVVLPPQFSSAPLVLGCIHMIPHMRMTMEQVVENLDDSIRRSLGVVLGGLPPETRLKINESSKLEGLAITRDPLEFEMTQLYHHLLSLPAQEVDDMINKAFASSQPKPIQPTQPPYQQPAQPPYQQSPQPYQQPPYQQPSQPPYQQSPQPQNQQPYQPPYQQSPQPPYQPQPPYPNRPPYQQPSQPPYQPQPPYQQSPQLPYQQPPQPSYNPSYNQPPYSQPPYQPPTPVPPQSPVPYAPQGQPYQSYPQQQQNQPPFQPQFPPQPYQPQNYQQNYQPGPQNYQSPSPVPFQQGIQSQPPYQQPVVPVPSTQGPPSSPTPTPTPTSSAPPRPSPVPQVLSVSAKNPPHRPTTPAPSLSSVKKNVLRNSKT